MKTDSKEPGIRNVEARLYCFEGKIMGLNYMLSHFLDF